MECSRQKELGISAKGCIFTSSNRSLILFPVNPLSDHVNKPSSHLMWDQLRLKLSSLSNRRDELCMHKECLQSKEANMLKLKSMFWQSSGNINTFRTLIQVSRPHATCSFSNLSCLSDILSVKTQLIISFTTFSALGSQLFATVAISKGTLTRSLSHTCRAWFPQYHKLAEI